jgi:hypothetical protein
MSERNHSKYISNHVDALGCAVLSDTMQDHQLITWCESLLRDKYLGAHKSADRKSDVRDACSANRLADAPGGAARV